MKELLDTGVQFGLDYYEGEEALIGKIKGYSAAVRENLATGSYGLLLWVRAGEYAAIKSPEDYLNEQKKLSPDLIRNFRVTERGIAVALARTEDAFTNLTHLKRFLYDFVDYLSLNFYVNCCCECGAAENLGIYDANGVITQACGKCGAGYRPILPAAEKPDFAREIKTDTSFSSGAVGTAAPAAFAEESVPKITEADEPLMENQSAVALPTAFTEESAKKITEADEPPAENRPDAGLFADFVEETAPKEAENGFESLLFGAEEEKKPEPPRSALFEEMEREYLREQAEAAESAPMEVPEDDGFDDMFFDEAYEEPPELPPEEPKREPVPEMGFSELLINDDGEVELKKEEPEVDDGTVVTEIHDDSNDGAPIDVTEIESLVLNPTITTGHPQLDAEETPLGPGGHVPLVNPNANREEKQVSPPDGPDAVMPLEENKNAYAASVRARPADEGGGYAAGYASSNDMIDRDARGEGFSKKRRSAPPPAYNQAQEHGAGLSGTQAPPPYDPSSIHSTYAGRISQSSNAFMGIIGALTCGVIGVVIWVLIACFLNMISRFGAISIVLTTFGGYYLAGRAMDKKGIVISSVLSLFMTFAGVVTTTAAAVRESIANMFGVEISFFETLNWLNYFLQTDAEIKSGFMGNLGISFVVTGISVVVSFIYLWRLAD